MSLSLTIKHFYTLTGHNASVYSLQVLSDHSFLSAGGDGWIVKWNLGGGDPELGKLAAKTGTQIFSIMYDQQTNALVAGDMHGELHFMHLDAKPTARRFQHHKKGVFGIYKKGQFVYSLGGGGMLSKWNIDTIGSVESVQLSSQSLRSMAFSSTTMYIGASDRNIYLIDLLDDKKIDAVKFAHENSVFSLAFDHQLQHLLSGGRDAMLNIWTEGEDLSIYKGLTAHLFTINAIKFNPTGRLFATASRDKTIKIWDAKSYKLLKVIEAIRDKGHINSVNDLLWLSETILISCSDDRTIKVWEINIKE